MNKLKIIINKYSIYVGYFCLLFFSAIDKPLGSFPEENMRYQIPKFIFEYGRLPTLYDASIYDAKYGFSYAGQPSLPYILDAILMKIASLVGIADQYLYVPARIVSMLLGCIFLMMIIKISRELFEKKIIRRIFVCLITLWNYTVYIFTYVNCDAMMLVGVSIIIFYCIKGLKSSWEVRHCLGLGLGNSIVILSYINGGSYSIVSVFIFVATYIFVIKNKNKYKEMFLKGALISAEVFVLSSWFYIRNIILYGSLFGNDLVKELGTRLGIKELTFEYRSSHAKEMMFSAEGLIEWIKGQLVSFCAKTVYKESILYNILYWLISIMVIILFMLGIYVVFKKRKTCIQNKIFISGMILGILTTLGIDFYYSAFVDYIPYYARYLIPMVISLGYFMTLGVEYLYDKNKCLVKKCDWVIFIFMIFVNIITFVL